MSNRPSHWDNPVNWGLPADAKPNPFPVVKTVAEVVEHFKRGAGVAIDLSGVPYDEAAKTMKELTEVLRVYNAAGFKARRSAVMHLAITDEQLRDAVRTARKDAADAL